MTRQTLSWTAKSMMIDATMAKAKAAPRRTVKSVVWVMNPGPTALVAIKTIAPSKATRVDERRVNTNLPAQARRKTTQRSAEYM